jgi:hypothetical protein
MNYLNKLKHLQLEQRTESPVEQPTKYNVSSAAAHITIEPAHPSARPVYWERATGEIVGPGVPEFLARVGDAFWVVAQFQGEPVWINSDRLRSRRQFEGQVKPKVVEFVKEPR